MSLTFIPHQSTSEALLELYGTIDGSHEDPDRRIIEDPEQALNAFTALDDSKWPSDDKVAPDDEDQEEDV
jgi:hypothetical protein